MISEITAMIRNCTLAEFQFMLPERFGLEIIDPLVESEPQGLGELGCGDVTGRDRSFIGFGFEAPIFYPNSHGVFILEIMLRHHLRDIEGFA